MLFTLFLCSLTFQAFGSDLKNPLPNWIDSSREKPDGNPPVVLNKEKPPADFRIPAEYEKVAAVVIGWAGYTDMLTSIARAAAGYGNARVWAAAAPDSIPGVAGDLYSKINAPVNTVWMRDYGPFGISNSLKKAGIVDTVYRHYQYRRDDDALPFRLGEAKGINVYGSEIIMDGGNFMVDSAGNLFMTKRTYIWNQDKSPEVVDELLRDYFKVKNIHSFKYAGYPGYPEDGTGHIDMFMKLLADDTVLISTAETEPFKSNAEKAIAFFANRTAPNGKPYKITTVKGWERYGTWYTYTNSLIVNNTVLIPSYAGYEAENAAAKKAYESGMPGVKVVEINSDSSIHSGGSIHCVTQTIPSFAGTKETGETNYLLKPVGTIIKSSLEKIGKAGLFE